MDEKLRAEAGDIEARRTHRHHLDRTTGKPNVIGQIDPCASSSQPNPSVVSTTPSGVGLPKVRILDDFLAVLEINVGRNSVQEP